MHIEMKLVSRYNPFAIPIPNQNKSAHFLHNKPLLTLL